MKGYFRKRGSKWSFTIDAGKDHQGKRKQKTMTGFKTKKEAQAAAAELINKIERGTYLEPKSTTVTEFIEEWLEDAKNRLRPSVIENTKVVTNKWIIPDLGRHKLKDLKPHHVNNLYALMKSHNLSSDYIRYAHSILRKSFNTAVKWQILERNIIELVDPPRLETKEIETWTREEANAFLDVAKEDNPFYYIIYVLAIYTGMRRGEILGLRWKDVDLEEASLSVRQTLIKVNTQPVFQEPKTKNARRRISIPSFAVEMLSKHRSLQKQAKLKFGSAYQDHGLVISTADGKPIRPDNLRRHFLRLIELADVPRIRFHDLRHTHATLLLQMGEHPKIVSERLGHSKVSVTLDVYSHVIPDMQKRTADAFEKSMLESRTRKEI